MNKQPTAVPGAPMDVPSHTTYDMRLGAYLHTGANAVSCVRKYLTDLSISPRHVALDIEAAGLGAKAFTMRCVTASFMYEGDTHYGVLHSRSQRPASRNHTTATDITPSTLSP